MKKCPRCQTQNTDSANFCANCGYSAPAAQPAPFVPISQPNKPKGLSNKVIIGGIVGFLVLFSIAGALQQNRTEKTSIASQTNSTFTPSPSPTATPAPTFVEMNADADRLLKSSNLDETDIKQFDSVMANLRTIPKESKDYKQAQILVNKLIAKVAPIMAEKLVLGTKPESSAYDGRVEPVVKYLKATMNDYEDSEWIEWSPVVKLKIKGEPYWAVRLKLRGKNAFGAKILKNMLFLIRNNQVVTTQDLPL